MATDKTTRPQQDQPARGTDRNDNMGSSMNKDSKDTDRSNASSDRSSSSSSSSPDKTDKKSSWK